MLPRKIQYVTVYTLYIFADLIFTHSDITGFLSAKNKKTKKSVEERKISSENN
jgi:hypothetical protein